MIINLNSIDLDNKTRELLVYITKNNPAVTITSLMKLSYFCDLVSVRRRKKQISKFAYKRYKHGPFDSMIYCYLEDLISNGVLTEEPDYTPYGIEYNELKFNKDNDFCFSELNKQDKKIIDDVLKEFEGYTAKTLTDVAYETSPMKALRATRDGNENLNAKLDLNVEIE